MSFNVRTIPNFDKEFKKLYKKYPSLIDDFEKILHELALNPQFGTSIGKGCLKYALQFPVKEKVNEAGRE